MDSYRHSVVNDSTSFVLSHLQMFSDKLHLSCERRIFSASSDLSQNEQREAENALR